MLKTALLLIYTMAMLAGCKKMVSLNEIPKANESIQKIDPDDETAIKALDQNKKIKDLDPKDQDKVADVAYKLIQDPLKFMQSYCHASALDRGDKCEQERNDCFEEAKKDKDLLTSNKEKIKDRIKASEYIVKDILNTMLVLTEFLNMSTSMDCGVSKETLETKAKELIAKATTLGVDLTNRAEMKKMMEIMVTIFIGDEVRQRMMAKNSPSKNHDGHEHGKGEHNHGKGDHDGGHAAKPVGGNKSK